MIVFPDIDKDATYADALETASGVTFCYEPPGEGLGTRVLNFGILAIAIIIIGSNFVMAGYRFGVVKNFDKAYIIVYAILVPAFVILAGFYLFGSYYTNPRRIAIKGGNLCIERKLYPTMVTSISNIVWVEAQSTTNRIFLTRGREIRIPLPTSRAAMKAQERFLLFLFAVAEKRTRENGETLAESQAVLPVSLSEGATTRRIPHLFFGFFLLIPPLLFTAIILKMMFTTDGPKQDNILSLFLLATISTFCLYILGKGFRRFWLNYGLEKLAFSREGLHVEDGTIPYRDVYIRLYRDLDEISRPVGGVLEVIIPELNRKIHIGPERQNFFILPYVLSAWAGESFRLASTASAPEGVRVFTRRDRVWSIFGGGD